MANSFDLQQSPDPETQLISSSPASYRLGNENLWTSLRAVHFNGRPAHADQLHVEIWWEGVNIAQDAGTYAYNDPLPWQNSLMATRIHNTISVNFEDQMQRAGKFLWLDWAQATMEHSPAKNTLSAYHDGYRKMGIRHSRTLSIQSDTEIIVEDHVDFNRSNITSTGLPALAAAGLGVEPAGRNIHHPAQESKGRTLH